MLAYITICFLTCNMLLLSTYLLFFSMPVYTKCDNDGRALCTGQFNYPKRMCCWDNCRAAGCFEPCKFSIRLSLACMALLLTFGI